MSTRYDDSRDEPRSGADLEAALDHAEKMLESFDRATRELRFLRMVQLGITSVALLVAALVATFATVSRSDGWSAAIWLVFVPLLVAGVGFRLVQVSVNEARRQRERDLSGLVQISRVVRDLLPVVAKTERWSELKHLTMRARIARFPISEHSL